jgi:hypothetical protein
VLTETFLTGNIGTNRFISIRQLLLAQSVEAGYPRFIGPESGV